MIDTSDKGQMIEALLNAGEIDEDDARALAEFSLADVREAYASSRCAFREDAVVAPSDEDEIDDDPRCVCGVYRSEHAGMGCPEGFQLPEAWAREREAIRARVFADDSDGRDDDGAY